MSIVCCIYHAPKAVDESSDESSSSDSDSDSEDDGTAKAVGGCKENCGVGRHSHHHGGGCPSHDHGRSSKGKGKGKTPDRSGNAYEKMPKPKSTKRFEKG